MSVEGRTGRLQLLQQDCKLVALLVEVVVDKGVVHKVVEEEEEEADSVLCCLQHF
jgi:hypothetical protein